MRSNNEPKYAPITFITLGMAIGLVISTFTISRVVAAHKDAIAALEARVTELEKSK